MYLPPATPHVRIWKEGLQWGLGTANGAAKKSGAIKHGNIKRTNNNNKPSPAQEQKCGLRLLLLVLLAWPLLVKIINCVLFAIAIASIIIIIIVLVVVVIVEFDTVLACTDSLVWG